MPIPGSLKRQQIDKNEIAQLLERQFNLPSLETLAYIQMLERSSVRVDELAETLALSSSETRDLLGTMISRGLIIRAPGSEEAFSPLHPRMTMRSEEHTSELQSRSDLVCRLLLEKKKKKLQ